MTLNRLLLATCLVAGALVVVWPSMRATRHRLNPSMGATGHPARWTRNRRETADGGHRSVPFLVTLSSAAQAWVTALAVRPVRAVAVSAGAVALAAWLLAGLVAGLIAAVYAGLGCRALTRGVARRRSAAAHARALDDLCALAADLRAGMPPPLPASGGSPAIASAEPRGRGPAALLPADPEQRRALLPADPEQRRVPLPADPGLRRIAELTDAVWRLAERTGAPAADLVERLEADARAGVRARASAAAQSAGAQATALLLAALPLGGIALGYAIGTDPLRVLLHTPLGMGCALGAAALQCAGLLWADRLTAGSTR
ncbi:tight adherence protein B [Krasilnikovia cinnamomea]|uniref:Tight adherence protein B n=1 Tax=Krasilnikovia cinnamomea TaxID=349313 RepID=A0A4Q7ZLT6_9ACTN|nr:hypothetical protein [Krasilnikovia cinnamomea]RZU51574.1 tight adherence protein B [Krasilnikovia cinnamomea]